ncbi:hypothetical protein BG011_001346 [Mortierella polycephala]|uniref:Uncharacterized protein n=1 Tax=Mortierella polycephala TaxID=41804 RepID=A0A9P6TVC4_9FUNG|nr:hypothetical protein BG011_001346 [Mortierella polycephala]
MSKSSSLHPFRNAKDVPNVFYFLNTSPFRYDAGDYFKTFSDLHSSKKDTLHHYWKNAINILLSSNSPVFKDNGNRLRAVWKTPDKGLAQFWAQQGRSESIDDDLRANTTFARKRAFRSVRHHYSRAFDAVDKNTSYESSSPQMQQEEKPTQRSKRRRPSISYVEDGVGVLEGAVEKEDEKDSEVEAEDDNASLSSDGSEFLPSRNEAQPSKVATSIFYLAGNGSTGCSKKLWTPWVVEGVDLSNKAWAFREAVCSKAKTVEPLSGSVEKLVVNHIYLFDSKDTGSGLYDVIGATHWAAITSISLKKLLSKDVLAELADYAIDLSMMNHDDAQDSVLDWTGNRDVKKVLSYLLADGFLWDDPDFNELEMIQHVFDPFLKTFISTIKGAVGRWDKVFLPSQERKEDAITEGRGRRPDYFMQCDFPGRKCFAFVMEAKKTSQKAVLQNDLEKVAFLMKDAIDNMARQRVDVPKLKVFGMVVVGVEGVVYSMELAARGIYLMKKYAVVYAPQSQFNLGVLGSSINVFMNLREELIKAIDICRTARLEKPTDLTRPSFGTPIKVTKHGVRTDFPTSPSLRDQ